MDNRKPSHYDLKKYYDYFFETDGFTTETETRPISAAALEAARRARGSTYGPAIMIQGIMPRSGTVYAGELLRRHPDLNAFPHQLWEFPALQLTGGVRQLQKNFILGYKLNYGRIGEDDFLPLFGASLLAYLHESFTPEQRLLIKMPGVQYLSQFFSMFPHENLLILIRDGRDLVHSTLKTWPRLNFIQVCLRWNRSAKAVIDAARSFDEARSGNYWLARYEDALENPVSFVSEACQRFCLDINRYPFEKIDGIKVIGSSKLEQNVTWKFIPKPKDFRPTGYWTKWSSPKKVIFKAIAGRSLIDLGYAGDNNW